MGEDTLNAMNTDDDDENFAMTRFLLGDQHDGPYNNLSEIKAGANGPCHWKQPLFRVHCGRLTAIRPEQSVPC